MGIKESIEFLKSGQSMGATDDNSGGFLVPPFIDVPSPGFINSAWRFIGRFLYAIGLSRLGYVAHNKGCHSVDFVEYLKSKVYHGT